MQLKCIDFNGAGEAIADRFHEQWDDLSRVMSDMPLHLKASDQKGIQDRAIFDPVGTNEHIAAQLAPRGWQSGIPIPSDFKFVGTNIDFGKCGVIVEVQFSNYPFLLNNMLRSDLFFRNNTIFHEKPTHLVILVTKSGMFPSSNSTLYYEQAIDQLSAFAKYNVFAVPMRLVGLFEAVGQIEATWTEYSARRYSRTVVERSQRQFQISKGRGGRCRIVPNDPLIDL